MNIFMVSNIFILNKTNNIKVQTRNFTKQCFFSVIKNNTKSKKKKNVNKGLLILKKKIVSVDLIFNKLFKIAIK